MAIAKKLKTKNGYSSGMHPKGANMRESWETHERPGVARWPRLTIKQQYVRSESKNNENKKIDKKQLKLRTSTKLEFLRLSASLMGLAAWMPTECYRI